MRKIIPDKSVRCFYKKSFVGKRKFVRSVFDREQFKFIIYYVVARDHPDARNRNDILINSDISETFSFRFFPVVRIIIPGGKALHIYGGFGIYSGKRNDTARVIVMPVA